MPLWLLSSSDRVAPAYNPELNQRDGHNDRQVDVAFGRSVAEPKVRERRAEDLDDRRLSGSYRTTPRQDVRLREHREGPDDGERHREHDHRPQQRYRDAAEGLNGSG